MEITATKVALTIGLAGVGAGAADLGYQFAQSEVHKAQTALIAAQLCKPYLKSVERILPESEIPIGCVALKSTFDKEKTVVTRIKPDSSSTVEEATVRYVLPTANKAMARATEKVDQANKGIYGFPILAGFMGMGLTFTIGLGGSALLEAHRQKKVS